MELWSWSWSLNYTFSYYSSYDISYLNFYFCFSYFFSIQRYSTVSVLNVLHTNIHFIQHTTLRPYVNICTILVCVFWFHFTWLCILLIPFHFLINSAWDLTSNSHLSIQFCDFLRILEHRRELNGEKTRFNQKTSSFILPTHFSSIFHAV